MNIKYVMLIIFLLSSPVFSGEQIDEGVIDSISTEVRQNSGIMETLSYLTDIYGPRLVGTPEYRAAADWVKGRLNSWGIPEVELESMDRGERGWRAESYSLEMIKPHYMRVIGYPQAWCRGTSGTITGKPIITGNIFTMDTLRMYTGQLKNKIVLVNKHMTVKPDFKPFATRFTSEDLQEAAEEKVSNPEHTLNNWETKKNLKDRLVTWKTRDNNKLALQQLLIRERPAVLIQPSNREHGIVRVDDIYFGSDQNIEPVPSFVVAAEHFSRLVRMIDKGIYPTLKVRLKTRYFLNPDYNVNVIAEIPGTDDKLKSEIVLIGAHLDSWHAGTGATDNAVSCAVIMEVMRLFKVLNLHTRRTVRMALWAGEEISYHGSLGYIRSHIGDISSGRLSPDHEQISVYLNLDNGAGAIRGIFLQGNENAHALFSQLLAPFREMHATTVALQRTSYTDHEPFDAMNIPAFQFIQDPLNYMTVTHHTNMDVYDYVPEEDANQNAIIIASLVYHLANREEMVPRKGY
jgi:carboxypeptidase Q